MNVLEHFAMQSQFLQKKAETLAEAGTILQRLTAECGNEKSIPWKTIIQLIEVYRMTQQLEHSWVKEIFTPEELKEYATFEAELKAHSTPEQQAAFEKTWANLVEEAKRSLSKDPSSAIGIQLGGKLMQWVNGVYGKKYAHLRTKKFEQGFGEGKGLDEVGLTPELVSWLDKAMDAYWRDRIHGILAQVGKTPSATLIMLWKAMLEDMYGDDLSRSVAIYSAVMEDQQVSQIAKDWLKNAFGLK